VLTKSDVCADPEGARREAARSALDTPVLVASGATGEGLEEVRALVPPGATAVLVGPSGAGKSTLMNALLGRDHRRVGEVRARDRRGKHVTTGRELLELPAGGMLIDGPGIRELKLWESTGLEIVFRDVSAAVAALAEGCRFRDCRHQGEPGCAVAAAVDRGEVDRARLESMRKLERETAAYQRRREIGAARAERERGRAIARAARQALRWKRGG
jgi:ribosome biogenesis GTPase